MNFILEVYAGDNFISTAKKAKGIAIEIATKTNFVRAIAPDVALPIVEFDFNDVKCLVDKNTNLDLLKRDYHNAHLMEWETIGTNCVEEYNKATLKKLEKKREANRLKLENYRKIEEAKDAAKKALVEERVANITLQIKEDKQELFNGAVEANSTEAYGLGALNYAFNWGKLLQYEISKGKTIDQCAEETSELVNFEGISGFMYGYAYALLRDTWVHGEELKAWKEKN